MPNPAVATVKLGTSNRGAPLDIDPALGTRCNDFQHEVAFENDFFLKMVASNQGKINPMEA